MVSMLGTVSHTAYPTVIAAIVILTAWALYHLAMRTPDAAPWTDIHTGVSIVLSGALLVQLSSVLHKNGR